MAISEDRKEFLSWCWRYESEDPDTQEWRDELTPEEEELVAGWDRSFNIGFKSLCWKILDHQVAVADDIDCLFDV